MESTLTEAQAKLEHLQELRKMWLDEAVKKGGVIDKAKCIANTLGRIGIKYPNTYVYDDDRFHIYYRNFSEIQFCEFIEVFITYNNKTVIDYTNTDIPHKKHLEIKNYIILHGKWINELDTLYSVVQSMIDKKYNFEIINEISELSRLLLVDEDGNPIDEVLNG